MSASHPSGNCLRTLGNRSAAVRPAATTSRRHVRGLPAHPAARDGALLLDEADKLGNLIPSIERERIRAASETTHEVVPIGLARNGAGGFQHDDGLTVVLDANRRLETECQRVGF
jgi:hypothetical protein